MTRAVRRSQVDMLVGIVSLSVILLASPARAEDHLAGSGSVAEWREKLARSELATAAYAAGVMAMSTVFAECKNSRTVRELHVYLLYRAVPTLTMKQAIERFLIEGGCAMISEERSPARQKTSATIYVDDY